jgi:hypothetical protein
MHVGRVDQIDSGASWFERWGELRKVGRVGGASWQWGEFSGVHLYEIVKSRPQCQEILQDYSYDDIVKIQITEQTQASASIEVSPNMKIGTCEDLNCKFIQFHISHTKLPVSSQSRTSFVHPLSKFDIQVIISERSRCGPLSFSPTGFGGAEAHSVPLV